jgi:hypothetical protein
MEQITTQNLTRAYVFGQLKDKGANRAAILNTLRLARTNGRAIPTFADGTVATVTYDLWSYRITF